MADAANAAEWDVRVGGYYNGMVAYATTKLSGTAGERRVFLRQISDFEGVDVSTNAEIFFLPSITLDNGIKIGASIQLEGEHDVDQINESYAYAKARSAEF